MCMKKLVCPFFSKRSQKVSFFTVLILFIGFFMLPNSSLLAQTSGLVTDKATGKPLEGVSVMVKTAQKGTNTNSVGRYLITADNPQNAILVFSLVGFKTIEEPIKGKTTINVELR